MNRLRARALLVALLAMGCELGAGTRDAPAFLRQPVGLLEGEGAVVGTILFSAPTGVSDAGDRQIVDALNAKPYEAVVAAEAGRERYRVRFFAGVEKTFVLRGAPGRYSIEGVTSVVTSNFGPQREGVCRLERLADLNLRAGQITYVGRLWMIAEYKPDRGSALAQGLRERGVPEADLAEAALDMRLGAVDVEKTREKLRTLEGSQGSRVVTELVAIRPGVEWSCSDPASSS